MLLAKVVGAPAGVCALLAVRGGSKFRSGELVGETVELFGDWEDSLGWAKAVAETKHAIAKAKSAARIPPVLRSTIKNLKSKNKGGP